MKIKGNVAAKNQPASSRGVLLISLRQSVATREMSLARAKRYAVTGQTQKSVGSGDRGYTQWP